MLTRTRIALAAAVILGTASFAAMAANVSVIATAIGGNLDAKRAALDELRAAVGSSPALLALVEAMPVPASMTEPEQNILRQNVLPVPWDSGLR